MINKLFHLKQDKCILCPYSNAKNSTLVKVIKNTVKQNTPVFGADIKYPSQ